MGGAGCVVRVVVVIIAMVTTGVFKINIKVFKKTYS
jgi:hypothetical protein